MHHVKGLITPIITPLDDNEDVCEKDLRKMINICVKNGFDGILVAGSCGEAMGMTQQQRNRAIKITLDEVGGKMPVICGVMDTSTRRVIENIKFVEQAGGKYVAVTPVFYTKASTQQEIIRHFELISKGSEAIVFIYNMPSNTGVNILPETVSELSKIDRVAGLKDSSGNWLQFQKLLFMFKDSEFALFQGVSEMAGISLLLGAQGFIPVYSFIFPSIYKELYNKAREGDIKAVFEIQNKVNQISDKLKLRAQPISGAKCAGRILELCSIKLCEPIIPIQKDEYQIIENEINEFFKRYVMVATGHNKYAKFLSQPEIY